MGIKKRFFVLASIMVSFYANSEARSYFSPEQKSYLINTALPQGLARIWKDDAIQACWKVALRGEDKSLASMYLIMNSRNTIDEMSEKRSKALTSSSSASEAYSNLKKAFDISDLNRVGEATNMLPIAWSYCRDLEKQQINS